MGIYGERIAKLREKKGYTQEEFASIIDVSRAALSHYEKNRRQPDYDTLIKIAEALGTSIDYLLGRTNQQYPNTPSTENPTLKEIESLSDESLKELENFIRILKIKDSIVDKTKDEQSSTLEKNA